VVLIGSWLAAAAVAALVIHLALRRYYGRNPRFWGWVEQTWLLLSFIGVTFAAVQVLDRLDTFKSEAAKAAIAENWAWSWQDIKFLSEDINHPEIIEAYSGKEALWRSSSSWLRRIAGGPTMRPLTLDRAENIFSTVQEFCANGVGRYRFSIDKWSEYYNATFGEDQLPPITEFSALAVRTCAGLYNISLKAKEAKGLDEEIVRLRWLTPFSVSWYFFLAVGFALKFAKNLSDLKRARLA
jgi:hypothetical protein